MVTKSMLIGATVMAIGISGLSAQTVDRDTVMALHQMAIEAGQTSSSADRKPTRSAAAIEAERRSIESHRAAFFARVHGRKPIFETKPADIAVVLPVPAKAPEPVDEATVLALRQMAIEAGQTSSSADKKPARSVAAIEAERLSIEAHRAAFFARIYGTRAGM